MAREFTIDEAAEIAEAIGAADEVDLEQFRMGLEVESEHNKDPDTDVVPGDDLETIGRIAWAHLREIPDYYTRLKDMEDEAMFEDDSTE